MHELLKLGWSERVFLHAIEVLNKPLQQFVLDLLTRPEDLLLVTLALAIQ